MKKKPPTIEDLRARITTLEHTVNELSDLVHGIIQAFAVVQGSFRDTANMSMVQSRRSQGITEAKDTACARCPDNEDCPYCFDPYNTDCDCLRVK